MIRVRLVTRGGDFVREVEIAPFEPPPDVLVWGSRLFLRDPCDDHCFREGCAVWIPT